MVRAVAADYYAELGLSRSADQDEIKRAYRKLAAQLHPDRNPGKPDIEARFKRVNTAFGVLSDEKKKQLYDQYGEMGLREGFDPNMGGFGGFGRRGGGGGGGFEDIFNGGGGGGAGIGDLFGDLFGGGGRRRTRKAPDIESPVTVEFVSAVRGAELELAMPTGRTVKVRIPQGARDGDKLRVKGAGNGAPGVAPGDLLLVLKVKRHPYFERDGLDLTLSLPLNAAEAYLGAKVEVPTINGKVTLKVPPFTQSGQLLRLRGKGVTRGKDTGDLYVRFMVQLPKEENEEISKAIQLIADATDDNLRDEISF